MYARSVTPGNNERKLRDVVSNKMAKILEGTERVAGIFWCRVLEASAGREC
jgi:hypothetical protein